MAFMRSIICSFVSSVPLDGGSAALANPPRPTQSPIDAACAIIQRLRFVPFTATSLGV